MRLHLKYGMPACSPNLVTDINHLKRNQRLATMLVTAIRHLPIQRETAAATAMGRPDYRIEDINGPTGCGSELFPLPLDAALKSTPKRYSKLGVLKYWNGLRASVNTFKNKLEKV